MEEERLEILIQVNPQNINFFNKIIEAYDNLALVTAVDPQLGHLLVRVTGDTKGDTIKLLKRMPFSVKILDL